MELIPLTFKKLLQSKAYAMIILAAKEKQFAIYTEATVGKNIQNYLTEEPMQRPYTHDLINAIFKGFDIKTLQIVINNVEDTIYFARLFLEKQMGEEKHILEIDIRPSDGILLSLIENAPLFCSKEVLDKVISVEV